MGQFLGNVQLAANTLIAFGWLCERPEAGLRQTTAVGGSPFVLLLHRHGRASLRRASGFGNTPTTSVWLLISLLGAPTGSWTESDADALSDTP